MPGPPSWPSFPPGIAAGWNAPRPPHAPRRSIYYCSWLCPWLCQLSLLTCSYRRLHATRHPVM